MAIKIDVSVTKVDIDIPKQLSKVRSDTFWLYAAQQWYRIYHKYVPFDTGMLADNVMIQPGVIIHTAPYARYIYNGDFNFQRDQHPLATRYWDQAAALTELPKLVDALQSYINSGRL